VIFQFFVISLTWIKFLFVYSLHDHILSIQCQSNGQLITLGILGNLGTEGNEKGTEGIGIANLTVGIFALIPSGVLGKEGSLGILGTENGGEGIGIANLGVVGFIDIPSIIGCLGIEGNLGNEGIENGGEGNGIANLGIIGDGNLHLLIDNYFTYTHADNSFPIINGGVTPTVVGAPGAEEVC
jgi:hypothetical protein